MLLGERGDRKINIGVFVRHDLAYTGIREVDEAGNDCEVVWLPGHREITAAFVNAAVEEATIVDKYWLRRAGQTVPPLFAKVRSEVVSCSKAISECAVADLPWNGGRFILRGGLAVEVPLIGPRELRIYQPERYAGADLRRIDVHRPLEIREGLSGNWTTRQGTSALPLRYIDHHEPIMGVIQGSRREAAINL